MGSPTQRSKKYLEKLNYRVGITEHWNPHAFIRQDLFGFIDMIGVKENSVVAVQTTSASNMSAREKKILTHENYPAVKSSGMQLFLHGWVKVRNRWTVKIKEL